MPHILLKVSYSPQLEHYPGATTAAEALQQDLDSAMNNTISFTELVEFASEVEGTVVDD